MQVACGFSTDSQPSDIFMSKWITGGQELKNGSLADEEIISVICLQTVTDEEEIKEEK